MNHRDAIENSTGRNVRRAGDRPCVECGRAVHPADAEASRKRHRTAAVLCLTCLRMIEQQLMEQRTTTHLERVALHVLEHPEDAHSSVLAAHRPGVRWPG